MAIPLVRAKKKDISFIQYFKLAFKAAVSIVLNIQLGLLYSAQGFIVKYAKGHIPQHNIAGVQPAVSFVGLFLKALFENVYTVGVSQQIVEVMEVYQILFHIQRCVENL